MFIENLLDQFNQTVTGNRFDYGYELHVIWEEL